MKLSIVIPVFNEKNSIAELLHRVETVDLGVVEKEIIIVDDCSTDGTTQWLKELENPKYKIIYHSKNQGKGTALRSGFATASGDIIVVQDADLEYNPAEYPQLIAPIVAGDADVVYGSRLVTALPHRVLYFYHYLGNKWLTFLSNLFTGLNLSDIETCYKVFSRHALQTILPRLRAKRFGIEPELTAQVAKHQLRVYEIGISYHGRTYKEGKKINWKDGLAAIWHIIRFNLFTKK